MEKFNLLVGLMFGKLYEEFPVPIRMTCDMFLDQVISEDDDEGSFNFDDYFRSTVQWLEASGYILIAQDTCSFDGAEYEVVLSERGLVSLRKVPESLSGTESIGERLSNFAKNKTSEAVSTLITLAITSSIQGGASAL